MENDNISSESLRSEEMVEQDSQPINKNAEIGNKQSKILQQSQNGQVEENVNFQNENIQNEDDIESSIQNIRDNNHTQQKTETSQNQFETPQKSQQTNTQQQQGTGKVGRRSNRNRSQIDLDASYTNKSQTNLSAKRATRRTTRQDTIDEEDDENEPQPTKRRNEFWKYRHKGERKPQEEQQIEQVNRLQFNHVNMENPEEMMKVSILKAQEFNAKLIKQKLQMKTVFDQYEKQVVQKREFDANKNMRFPNDMPTYLYDKNGRAYYHDAHQHKEQKGTIEQFIHLNVQHEHSLMYVNELNRQGSLLNKNIFKQKKRKRRTRAEMQQRFG